jgi:murein DD-endopeptidase MepM/ murein hydrolase activator NlpD
MARLPGYHALNRCRPESVPLRTAKSPAGIARQTPTAPKAEGDTESSSHDDLAYVKRHPTDRASARPAPGWSSTAASVSPHRTLRRRLAATLLLLPLVVGLLGSPASPQGARGDELSDARDRQQQLKRDAAAEKARVARLDALQRGLAAQISQTASELRGINVDLTKVRARIDTIQGKVAIIRADYAALVGELADLDASLVTIETRETAKRTELAGRKALLAERLRSAYDTDRTSPLESFLSGGSFTDLIAEMSYYIDIGEQDKALATQIAKDQETLAALHQETVDTRARTDDLRLVTAAQKRALDASLDQLRDAKAQLKVLERRTAAALAAQRRTYEAVQRSKAAARAAFAAAAEAQRKLQAKIDALIRKRAQQGNIPSQYNGTLSWPMNGDVTQNFGCTGFSWEPPFGSCPHYHNGIDIVAPNGTQVRSSGTGTVAYCGWNYADGPDPAWIVIVAHSTGLQTWYAHMQPNCPVKTGHHVNRGQVIGHEGSTGHSTGPHLHWGVRLNDDFVNPRLFL